MVAWPMRRSSASSTPLGPRRSPSCRFISARTALDSASTRGIFFTSFAWVQPHGRALQDCWQKVANVKLVACWPHSDDRSHAVVADGVYRLSLAPSGHQDRVGKGCCRLAVAVIAWQCAERCRQGNKEFAIALGADF